MLSSPSDLNLFITVRWVAIVAISGKHEIVLIKIKISVFLYIHLNHVKDPAHVILFSASSVNLCWTGKTWNQKIEFEKGEENLINMC